MSRMNDDIWAYAYKYWGKMNRMLGIFLAITTVVLLLSIKGYPDFETLVTYLVFGQIGVMALTIISTERRAESWR